QYLVRLMKQLHSDLHEVSDKISRQDSQKERFSITRWDGPGAIAASLLRHYNLKDQKSQLNSGDNHDKAIKAQSRIAYAGARIELYQLGHTTKKLYHYDLRSAYPSAM